MSTEHCENRKDNYLRLKLMRKYPDVFNAYQLLPITHKHTGLGYWIITNITANKILWINIEHSYKIIIEK